MLGKMVFFQKVTYKYNSLDVLYHAGVQGLQNKSMMPGNAGTGPPGLDAVS